jgi:hypothetical protein
MVRAAPRRPGGFRRPAARGCTVRSGGPYSGLEHVKGGQGSINGSVVAREGGNF